MPECPDCGHALGSPVAVKFKSMSRREFYACDHCRTEPLLVGERKRDFDAEDAEADSECWGPILWDLGALPAGHPFAEAA